MTSHLHKRGQFFGGFPRMLLAAGIWLAGAGLIAAGSAWDASPKPASGIPDANVYRLNERLEPHCRRVAVLPLAANASEPETMSGAAALDSVLHAELGKCALFELVFISPADVKRWTGKFSWAAEEKLPAELLKQVGESSGCDAVLFARLAQYRAYAPLQIGWNLKLVDAATRQILWAVDEVYDAGQPAVADQAKHYYRRHGYTGQPLQDRRTILMSPRLFGEYAASAALATLPKR